MFSIYWTIELNSIEEKCWKFRGQLFTEIHIITEKVSEQDDSKRFSPSYPQRNVTTID